VTLAGIVVLLICGLMVGSFLNVCISRIPAGQSVVLPGSRCPSCLVPIRWYDNIPVVSYTLLSGRCRACRATISLRYPVIEAATGLAFLAQGLAFDGDVPLLVSRLVLTSLLVALFGTDLETERLPNILTIPGTIAGLLFAIWLPPGLVSSLAGIAAGSGLLLLLRWSWRRATGTEAMGLGDVKMMAMIGAFLGWQGVWIVLFMASVAGALVGIGLATFAGRSMKSRLPFGTFLALAAFVASLFGNRLVTWYLQLYR
jgi:leader peptidase (prepilin peptidase)/N-methyltransferase